MKLKNRAKIMVSNMLLAVGAALFLGFVPGFGIVSTIGIATGIVSIAVPLVIAAVAGLVVGGIVAAGMHYLGKSGSDKIADLGDSPLVTGLLSTLLASTVLAVPAMIVGTLFPPLIPVIAVAGVITLGVTFIISCHTTQKDDTEKQERVDETAYGIYYTEDCEYYTEDCEDDPFVKDAILQSPNQNYNGLVRVSHNNEYDQFFKILPDDENNTAQQLSDEPDI